MIMEHFLFDETVPWNYVLSFMGNNVEHINKPNFRATSPPRSAGLKEDSKSLIMFRGDW